MLSAVGGLSPSTRLWANPVHRGLQILLGHNQLTEFVRSRRRQPFVRRRPRSTVSSSLTYLGWPGVRSSEMRWLTITHFWSLLANTRRWLM